MTPKIDFHLMTSYWYFKQNTYKIYNIIYKLNLFSNHKDYLTISVKYCSIQFMNLTFYLAEKFLDLNQSIIILILVLLVKGFLIFYAYFYNIWILYSNSFVNFSMLFSWSYLYLIFTSLTFYNLFFNKYISTYFYSILLSF